MIWWLKKERDHVLPKSSFGQAFTYTLNQWQALCRYTADGVDGALEIDHNLAERMMKLSAIGRKNWLFRRQRIGWPPSKQEKTGKEQEKGIWII